MGCAKRSERHVEVKLDAEQRPLEVFVYVVDKTGAKIRDGESLKYEWETGVVHREHYQNGVLVGADFETTAKQGYKPQPPRGR